MMGSSAALGLGTKLGIFLGCLTLFVVVAGLSKLVINRRRLSKDANFFDLEATHWEDNTKKISGSKLGVKGLFGIKALHFGYFGCTAQGRASSPTPPYAQSAYTTLLSWGEGGKYENLPTTSNAKSLPHKAPKTKKKPAPLHLQSSNIEMKGLSIHSPTSASPRSILLAHPQAQRGWVSPLDVHFSQPATPDTPATKRPKSYLPRLHFSDEISKFEFGVADSITGAKPKALPIIGAEVSSPPASASRLKSPTFLFFPPPSLSQKTSPSHPYGSRSPILEGSGSSSPRNKKSPKSNNIPQLPQSPKSFFSPKSPMIHPNLFPESPEFSERPKLRQSIASKRTVSIHQPKSPAASKIVHSRAPSEGSSLYSTRTSILNEDRFSHHSRSRARSIKSQNGQTRARSQKSLARARDSLQHTRDFSQYSLPPDEAPLKGNQKQELQKPVLPREEALDSPFSNAMSVFSHSAQSSISSTSSTSSFNDNGLAPNPRCTFGSCSQPGLDPTLKPSLLTVEETTRSHRNSQASSIGEFYDSYYRHSIMMHRLSAATKLQGLYDGGVDMVAVAETLNTFNANMKMSVGLKRPAPLMLRGWQAVDNIDLPSPMPSPAIPHPRIGEGERYPSMI